MARTLTRLVTSLLGTIVGVGCSNGQPQPDAPEYGTPLVIYRVAGTARAADDAQPIADIELALDQASPAATSETDGTFSLVQQDTTLTPVLDHTFSATDVDGAANGGSFSPASIDVSLVQTDPGDGKWNKGTYEAIGVVVEMDRAAGGGGTGGASGGGGAGGG